MQQNLLQKLYDRIRINPDYNYLLQQQLTMDKHLKAKQQLTDGEKIIVGCASTDPHSWAIKHD